MGTTLPDFKAEAAKAQNRLGEDGVSRILEAGRAWGLANSLRAGGSVIFPHAGIETCGHQIAAAVHACLNSGTERVLVIGVLHALTQELQEARVRVAGGGDLSDEPYRGIQGPGLDGHQHWKDEFSLSHFMFLWREETRRRGITGPELIVRYPCLAGGHPESMPGIEELQEIARDAVIVATADPFHHGIGYGDSANLALSPEAGGLELARRRIEEGLALLRDGDHWSYNRHCVEAKSDARDTGQVLRHLLGPVEGRILDLVADDMSAMYEAPAPTWVAGALIELRSV